MAHPYEMYKISNDDFSMSTRSRAFVRQNGRSACRKWRVFRVFTQFPSQLAQIVFWAVNRVRNRARLQLNAVLHRTHTDGIRRKMHIFLMATVFLQNVHPVIFAVCTSKCVWESFNWKMCLKWTFLRWCTSNATWIMFLYSRITAFE